MKVDSLRADPVRKGKASRGLQRLTTDEFNEQKDLIEMTKPLAVIRRQSILNIPEMSSEQRVNIQ